MSIWKKIITAVRGGASEVGEAIVDANAIRILEQEMRDADKAVLQGQLKDLQALMGDLGRLRVAYWGSALRVVGEFDAELQQPIGQPRPVEVPDPSGENFGPGHHDARTHAHGDHSTALRGTTAD